MGKRSRNKGSGFELKTAKELTRIWGGNFSRVPASGGLHWENDQRVAGDIIPPPESNFPFVVECKKVETDSLRNLFLNIGLVKDWWEQVTLDAKRVSLTPMLVFSKNRDKMYVLLPYSERIYKELDGEFPVSRQTVSYKNVRDELQYFDTVLMTLDGFESIEKKKIIETYKGIKWDKRNQ